MTKVLKSSILSILTLYQRTHYAKKETKQMALRQNNQYDEKTS